MGFTQKGGYVEKIPFPFGRNSRSARNPLGVHTVMDPKNWTLPVGVEWRTRNEVQDAKEAQEL